MQDTIWFILYNADSRKLQSVYVDDDASPDAPGVISPGIPFKVSLEADELCQRIQPLLHRPGSKPTTCSDSELLTLALVGECRGRDSDSPSGTSCFSVDLCGRNIALFRSL
jgi:hypothetical protein